MVEYQKLTFQCRWVSQPKVPSFFGSYLRGQLGKHLWRASCALRRRRCNDCPLIDACAYGFLFETKTLEGQRQYGAINVRPHPFALELKGVPFHRLRKDQGFSFSIILFGRNQRYIPHIIYAAIKSGESGIGRETREGNGRFHVERIKAFDTVIYSRDTPQIEKSQETKCLTLFQDEVSNPDEVFVRFQTPLRTKFNGKYTKTVPFHILIRTALRRIEALETWYGDGSMDHIDHKDLIEAAQAVATVEERLRWQEVPRFSYRQKAFMKLGGVVGYVRYRGATLKRFLPILNYVATAHLGKQTSFGLGWMELDVE